MKRISILLVILILGGCDVNLEKNVSTEVSTEIEECTDSWAICMLNFNQSKDVSDPNPVKVAILDSGINAEVEQLKGYIVKSYNTFNNSSKTSPVNDHGTMIASIVAFTNYNGMLLGLNNNVQLYDVQVLNDTGAGQIENTVSGIDWAIEQGVDIINISYGFSKDDMLIREAIKRAYDHGIIIVAATGNTIGLSTDFPAKYPEVLSISAIDDEMNIFSYAGKGKVDYVTPGVNVPVLNMQGKIEYQNGTSFATAYATGVISLLKSKMDNDAVIEYLKKNSMNLGPRDTYGQGLIQFKEEN